MKRIIFILIVFVVSYGDFFAQSKNVLNPIYLGLVLIDQPSEEKMDNICEYYNLIEEPGQNDYRVFRHANGTEFRFKADENNSQFTPVVKVIISTSTTIIDGILSDAGYIKETGGYVKGTKYEHRRTRCKVSGNATKTLTFSKEYNSL